mmetsp:Transcript_30141/g.60554  ORF Transcript_30141/g.60554 Transcript_30141/m.60554 type:complete len:98 (-) Transcript_30141:206-499(-)
MSESYSPLKDFASPQGGATCDTSPLSFNITNHIHHSVEFGQSTVMSPVTMSHFGDHKPEKLNSPKWWTAVVSRSMPSSKLLTSWYSTQIKEENFLFF